MAFILARTKQTIARALNKQLHRILPFADLSPGKDQSIFSDGLTDELINDLPKYLTQVVARSSALQFKGRNEDSPGCGRKLGVAECPGRQGT